MKTNNSKNQIEDKTEYYTVIIVEWWESLLNGFVVLYKENEGGRWALWVVVRGVFRDGGFWWWSPKLIPVQIYERMAAELGGFCVVNGGE